MKKKRKKSKKTYLIIILFIVGYFIATLYQQQREMFQLNAKEQQYLSIIEKTNWEIERLKKEIENSHTDKHIEKIARQNLRMIKADEMVFIDLGKFE